jgi:ATP-dependent exoDNAse (exonuclease V) beta subunit
LLGLAGSYEESCSTNRQTASVAGLITFLFLSCRDALQPANPDDHAVQVLTYHKAKGLEWPMVIMSDLDAPPPATPFGVYVPKAFGDFDPYNPLTGRTIHYWPWPYGLQKADIDLSASAQSSPEMTEASFQRDAESLRLLYVGMTRPRDYLILACRETGRGADWLHMARDSQGNSVFQLDASKLGKQNILRHSADIFADCISLAAPDQGHLLTLDSGEQRYESTDGVAPLPTNLPYSCAASRLILSQDNSSDSVVIDKSINLGGRLRFSEEADMRLLGEALHLFLATDDTRLKIEDRLDCASKIAKNFRVTGLAPEQFVLASTRLRDTLDELYPDAIWLPEWPVTGRHGSQRIMGAIDLLLELSEGYVIIDHKSFPGSCDAWNERAISHYPQLDAYAQLVHQATLKSVIASYIHMPIAGTLLSFRSTNKWTSEQLLDEDVANGWLVF